MEAPVAALRAVLLECLQQRGHALLAVTAPLRMT
jgi:hypothetical protein